MAVFIETNTDYVYSHGRLDPEYFLPVHTILESKLDQLQCEKLGRLGKFTCSAFYPAATHLYEKGDMPFLRCVDIIDYPIIHSEQPFAQIPKDFVINIVYKMFKTGDM
jgi:hypothetical protein